MNWEIIENLEILSDFYNRSWKKNKSSKDNFRRLAYNQAVNQLKKIDYKITNINQLKKIKGFGKSIIEKIKEFLDTGKIAKVEEIKYEENKDINKEKIIKKFLNIWGVGNVKANLLYEKGIRSIYELESKQNELLNRQQIIGLKYYEDLLEKIPRLTITIIQTIIRYILNKKYGENNYKMDVAGSYRRNKNFSSDIDILISSDYFDLEDIVTILKKNKIIKETLSMQKEKFMGIGNCPKGDKPFFRIDIEFLPYDEYAYGLLYFTGSKDFNKEIRLYAKRKGYTLSQHGLKDKNGVYIPARNEEEIFNILDLKYLKPELRS